MNDETNRTTEPTATSSAAASAAPASRVRRVLLTALPVGLVLAVVGGAAGYTNATVGTAERKVTTTVWDKDHAPAGKDPAGNPSRGRHDTELSQHLLPVPKGYRLGPDIGEHGNDNEISGAKAAAAVKETGRGLAGKDRRKLAELVDRLRIQGLAQRSYTSEDNNLVANIQIVKMGDRSAVRESFTERKALLDSFGVLRKGPRIEGHKNAVCYRLPKGDKNTLDGVVCFAYEGEISVSFEAQGSKPFSPSGAGDLLKDQLDHITSPGEYI
ncbi:hypothetical protein B7C62_19115 [Kitasatospora albolonga]|uniref:Secreted protein n=1 Tax=Kitasatospora albolonga TaxID=68173 RepID=A0ABC8BUV6_9ACTN|nr:hypothetical protein B7C62_19115 [Kitasatospora albolonga]